MRVGVCGVCVDCGVILHSIPNQTKTQDVLTRRRTGLSPPPTLTTSLTHLPTPPPTPTTSPHSSAILSSDLSNRFFYIGKVRGQPLGPLGPLGGPLHAWAGVGWAAAGAAGAGAVGRGWAPGLLGRGPLRG